MYYVHVFQMEKPLRCCVFKEMGDRGGGGCKGDKRGGWGVVHHGDGPRPDGTVIPSPPLLQQQHPGAASLLTLADDEANIS